MRVGVAVCRWAPGSGLWKCKMGKFEGTTLAGEKPGLHCWPGAAPGSKQKCKMGNVSLKNGKSKIEKMGKFEGMVRSLGYSAFQGRLQDPPEQTQKST